MSEAMTEPTNEPLSTGPTPRQPVLRSRRQALGVLLASGAAIVGIVVLVVLWLSVGARTLEASAAGGDPCLEAYAADQAGAEVSYGALPPQAVCSWEVDGERQEVVVTSAPTALAATATVLAVGGVIGAVALLVVPRLRDSR
ncbi:hypothetical protein GXP71_02135 [Cellulomonas sp. H30R-01]|uniref:hypothetical protein n=1 Tax=Cellulomonas sp. H30R-01 TaxID=2704467 RepID=UPI00138D3FA5|nr:hypothetical protein [Cellulomonas sp. H30R-01]QHT55003.1 hypothetical protein GXP71_02135 [Cellulomonas sp. H30R-01]